jgi:predicted transcriptional regulator
MEDGKGHTGSETAETLDLPYSAVDVAFQFLKQRGVIQTRHKRRSYGASTYVFEDAMTEFHALREHPERNG